MSEADVRLQISCDSEPKPPTAAGPQPPRVLGQAIQTVWGIPLGFPSQTTAIPSTQSSPTPLIPIPIAIPATSR